MKPCMVLFDDEQGMVMPFGADPECEGGICCYSADNPPIVFRDRAAARRAIRISKAHARLRLAQGKPVNTDFTEDAGCIKVVPVVFSDEAGGDS